VKRLVAGLLGVLLVVTGCAGAIDGSPVAGVRDADPAAFFADAVPTYGQTLTDDELATQAYLRAMRRTDPCGFTTPKVLAGIGEITFSGTTDALNQCELGVKVPGDAEPRTIGAIVTMDRVGAEDGPVFTVGELPVYRYPVSECSLQMPLPLAAQPGAPPLDTADQPYLQLQQQGSEQDCDFVKKLVKATAVALDPARLPVRDALAVYPVPMADRDPCAVLGDLDGVVDWDAGQTRPYTCEFTLRRSGADVDIELELRPLTPRSSDGDHPKVQRDGVEVSVVRSPGEYCAAVTFLGELMQRRSTSGEPIGIGEWPTAPAVSVAVDAPYCDVATDVAVAASKAFR
jgi:hypothetical protein